MSMMSEPGLRRTQSTTNMSVAERRKAITMDRRRSSNGFGSGIRRFLRQRMANRSTNVAGVPKKNAAPRDLVRKLLDTTPFSFLNQNFRSNTKEWKRFAALFEIQTYGRDDVIVPEGVMCDSVYIIAEGTLLMLCELIFFP